jgi:transposase
MAKEATVQLQHPVCCGIDVGSREVVACLRRVEKGGTCRIEHRTFPTMVQGLLKLLDWLVDEECPVVAMESTGVYWKPVYQVLAAKCSVVLGNSREIRQRPGKKTDKADAAWIAELLAHGLITPSFVPPPTIQALRELTRTRVSWVQMRSQAKNQVHKFLEDTGIKLGIVASDVFGVSGRAMLAALIAGERSALVLAELARGRLRSKLPELRLALVGRFTDLHATMIGSTLSLIDHLSEQIAVLDAAIDKAIEPFTKEHGLLTSIPGVGATAARDIVAEIGVDMARFRSAQRLASWSGMCPGNNESAGKRKTGKTRKGNKWLRRILTECAWGARYTPSHLGNRFRQLERRIGGKKAALAVGHQILVIAWHLLKNGTLYEDSRYDSIRPREAERRRRNYVRGLEQLGFTVTLEAAAA